MGGEAVLCRRQEEEAKEQAFSMIERRALEKKELEDFKRRHFFGHECCFFSPPHPSPSRHRHYSPKPRHLFCMEH